MAAPINSGGPLGCGGHPDSTSNLFKMLQSKAVKYTNATLDFFIVDEPVNVEVDGGSYKLPSDHSVLVRIKAAALNPVDLIIKQAMTPWLFKAPRGFGFDYCGDVVAIGSAAAAQLGLSVGDRVAGLFQEFPGTGTVTQYKLFDASKPKEANMRKIPDSFLYQQGAAYPLVHGTAVAMYDTVPKGNKLEKVLILGAGTTVGRYCVQLAKNVYNVKEIVVTCLGRTEEVIRENGATEVIDYTQHKSVLGPALESVKTSGAFDVVFDCCGNSDLFPQLDTVLKPAAEHPHYVTVVGDYKNSFVSHNLGGNLITGVRYLLRTIGTKIGWIPYTYTFAMVSPAGPWPDVAARYLAEGKTKPFIDSEYSMLDVAKAVERLASNKAQGKVIINID